MLWTIATTTTQTASQAPETLSLPWGAPAIAGAGLVAGFLLWLWGRKLVKPLYALVFGVGAGLIGFTGPAMLGLNVDPNILMIALGLFGVIVGLIVFRITMGLTLGVVLGFVVATGAVIAIDAQDDAAKAVETAPIPDEESIYREGAQIVENLGSDEVQRNLDELAAGLKADNTNDSADTPDQESDAERIARSASKRVRAFMLELWNEVGVWWETIPIRLRVAALGGWLAGFALGLLLGLARPTLVAGFASAFVGAAIWLPSGAYLAHWAGLSIPGNATAWAGVWVVASCIGAGIQWTKRKPSADQRDEED